MLLVEGPHPSGELRLGESSVQGSFIVRWLALLVDLKPPAYGLRAKESF